MSSDIRGMVLRSDQLGEKNDFEEFVRKAIAA
jgi:hypothetical protein